MKDTVVAACGAVIVAALIKKCRNKEIGWYRRKSGSDEGQHLERTIS